jgi:hypothetical protein
MWGERRILPHILGSLGWGTFVPDR